MITDIPATATDLVEAVAGALAPLLGAGDELAAGELTSTQVELPVPYAVLAAVGGAATGEIAVFVDQAFAAAVGTPGLAEADLAAALAPSLEELGRSLGSTVLGPPQATDAATALSRLGTRAQSVLLPLHDGTTIRAAVAVGLDDQAVRAVAPVSAPAAPVMDRERLDLLRGVEMAATAELGRARMTVNELLALRDGSIIELDRAAGESADLFVNGRLIARGEVVVVDENYALRITQIVTDEPGH